MQNNQFINAASLTKYMSWKFKKLNLNEFFGLRFLPLRKNEKILTGKFDSPEAAISAINQHAGNYHFFSSINPIGDLQKLSTNELKDGLSFGDSDVSRIIEIIIDVDPVRPSGVAANESEQIAAQQVVTAIYSDLEKAQIKYRIYSSGNGYHISIMVPSYSIDRKNEVAELLKFLDKKYSTNEATVDVTMGNPSKICRIPGTLNLKGDNSLDRPFRMAEMLFDSNVDENSFDLLNIFRLELDLFRSSQARMLNIQSQAMPLLSNHKQADYSKFNGDITTIDMIDLCKSKNLYVRPIDQDRHIVLCPNREQHSSNTDGTSTTVIFGGGFPPTFGFKCMHSHCEHIDTSYFLHNYFTTEDVDKHCALEFQAAKKKPLMPKRFNNEFNFQKLSDILNQPPVEYEFVVANLLLNGGFSLLASQPKVGKTTFLRDLAVCVASGSEFLGMATRKGPVLILALEELVEQMRKEFKKMPNVDGLEILIHAAPAPSEPVEKLTEQIELYKPVLVIVDTMHKFARFKDGNSYAEVNAALDPLLNIARLYECHVMCSHHLGKDNTRDNGNQILGSTAIHAAFDCIVFLKTENDLRMMEVQYRYQPSSPFVPGYLSYDPFTASLSFTAKEVQRTETVENSIIEMLSVSGEKTIEEIKEELKVKAKVLSMALNGLYSKGRLVRQGDGKKGSPFLYSLPKDSIPY